MNKNSLWFINMSNMGWGENRPHVKHVRKEVREEKQIKTRLKRKTNIYTKTVNDLQMMDMISSRALMDSIQLK